MPNVDGEAIFIRLYDVGSSIDLERVLSVFPGIQDKKFMRSKDTPEYIHFPRPLRLDLTYDKKTNSFNSENILLRIKMYKDGVISLAARLKFNNFPLEQLHVIRKTEFNLSDGLFTIDNWLGLQFDRFYDLVKNFILRYSYPSEQADLEEFEQENYVCFCITNNLNPLEFVEQNKDYIATLLMGESPELNLDPSQIQNTLKNRFSFMNNDLVIFDSDRAFIIDPNLDYDDVLLIVELANYQLLKLRTLDTFVDETLNIAENDIRVLFLKRPKFWRKLNKKLGQLFRFKFDMVFILENIENVSKITGDFYLAQLYEHLSNLFDLKKWIDNIHHRLSILGDIYITAKTSANERIILIVEILLGVIFTLEFIFIIIDLYT
ncbi:MAG: hypothetical protein EU542_09380 [Promethearchaeota archaeon]|nr:MAG: hypothetical protein EU542_09380 [Candidatus Lokiarchaeota archaeon]